jgi:hypothetical protein
MQPTILDNDMAIYSTTREPRSGDIVIVAPNGPHPYFDVVSGYVWRYHKERSRRYLTKDNPKHVKHSLPVVREQIIGVVTRVIHREFREPAENHANVQQHVTLFRECKRGKPPADLGFYLDAKLAQLRSVFSIPDSELIAGWLPWGLFRAAARVDHLHMGITARDTLTIAATPETHVGLIVVVCNDDGENLIGLEQRERLSDPTPGEFYIDVGDRRVVLTQDGGRLPLWSSIGVIRRIDRRGGGTRPGVGR